MTDSAHNTKEKQHCHANAVKNHTQ